jgi:hypothetical protein
MEINFNPSGISQTESSQPVSRQASTPPATDAASFSTSDALTSQLNKISTVRPEKVAQAQTLVSDGKYPPDDVLDRIAVLLAVNHMSMGALSQTTEASQ